MSRYDPANIYGERPQVNLIPLIDIVFFALVFFMVLSVYYQVESQMDIRIPEASQARVSEQKTEFSIDINAEGNFIVNGKTLTTPELEDLLKKTPGLSSQSIIIRADQKTYHQHVIKVLDLCARNNIKDVSFATQTKE
jgi:biopolymer transport protein ExbD